MGAEVTRAQLDQLCPIYWIRYYRGTTIKSPTSWVIGFVTS